MESPNRDIINLYKMELSQPYSSMSAILLPPYSTDDSKENKISATKRALSRSIRLKSRTLALTNAYFLGLLINEEESISEKFCIKRNLTKHYSTMAEYVYDIFEPNPTHLLYTTTMNVQEIKKMKRNEVLYL